MLGRRKVSIKRKRNHRPRKPRWLVIFLASLLAAFFILEFLLAPTITAFAEAEANWRATEAINEAILSAVVEDMDYAKLVHIEKDEKGNILYMQQNLLQLNKINTKATLKIQEELKKLRNQKIQIPIGQITGSNLLANYGPSINLWLLPVGTVEVKVQDKFEDAGINQTRHKIYLNVSSDIRVIIPLLNSEITVNAQVPVADTVIVGDVPETYLKLDLGKDSSLFGISDR
ncbi:sporulation protein YunB [Metallumcola ferriviriculae]|uniref:Sporulation protein YunB n=1 Tax=Metallumcola ferriviriculae TaxID=3039180 RepID=A0AAU0USH0_9FIRM|nr:sporulation protein YunB [Desulfitibacteraceae bacterium MK1]